MKWGQNLSCATDGVNSSHRRMESAKMEDFDMTKVRNAVVTNQGAEGFIQVTAKPDRNMGEREEKHEVKMEG